MDRYNEDGSSREDELYESEYSHKVEVFNEERDGTRGKRVLSRVFEWREGRQAKNLAKDFRDNGYIVEES